jgi:hypothetical protein
MSVEFTVLKKQGAEQRPFFREVDDLANELRRYLDEEDVTEEIRKRHVLGAPSSQIQAIVMQKALELGFQSEKKRLFANSDVPGLRPDYYRPVGNTGILLEVERGKTTTNNMDLLDLWKCHICERASYLFLLVPQARPSANGRVLRHFKQVTNRLGTFLRNRTASMSMRSICSATE